MYKGGRGGPLQQNKMTTDKGGGGKPRFALNIIDLLRKLVCK